MPPGLQPILRRMLAKAPEERYATAEALCRELRAQLHTLSPGYGRAEAAQDMARVIIDASGMRGDRKSVV